LCRYDERTHEYGSYIMEAMETNQPARINGNIPNTTGAPTLGNFTGVVLPLKRGYITYASDSGHQAPDSNDALASFSHFGAASVHLGAPGVGILSTTANNTYSFFNGTSMATPHVAGAAALLLAANPNLTVQQLKSLLIFNGDQVASLSGKTLTGRRLSVANSFQARSTRRIFGLHIYNTVEPVFALSFLKTVRAGQYYYCDEIFYFNGLRYARRSSLSGGTSANSGAMVGQPTRATSSAPATTTCSPAR